MSTPSDKYETIKQQALDRIAEITLQPKPSYNIDGQQEDWAGYLQRLQELVAWCDEQIAASETYMFVSQARPV